MRTDSVAALRRGELAGARVLKLAERLVELPPEVFGLADSLEVLDLSGNALRDLPADLGRLARLRVLFCSGNPFERLPPVLGDCVALEQVGFRGCGLRAVPAEALPARLRWLTLTNNRIEILPAELGRRQRLQKLMLSGNRIERLPDGLAGADRLELLRLAENRLARLPNWLAELPRLAWLSWAGNPFDPGVEAVPGTRVPEAALAVGAELGRGSTGTVHRAEWRRNDGAVAAVAVKRFVHAGVGSDGTPAHERAAAVRAGDHPCLVGALGEVAGGAFDGALVMPLVPDGWEVLAEPPSLRSCSRDVYAPGRRFALPVAVRIAADAAAAMAWLHGSGLLHGDLYGHNLLHDPRTGAARLGDLGAASSLGNGGGAGGMEGERWRALDVLAWGILLGELVERCEEAPAALEALRDACLDRDPAARPEAEAVAAAMRRIAAGIGGAR